jgi:catechol 2,3-dioxygenase-like lactoylglutathione lyase family enzyme
MSVTVMAGPPLPNDPMEPIADAAGANAGPLSGALVVTRDVAGIRRAYVDGAGLSMQGPIPLEPAARDAQRALWGLPAGMGWDLYLLTRPSLPDAIRVLVIVPDRDTPVIRASYEREETGPYALGFPMRDVPAVDARMAALGLRRTLPDVNRYPLQLRDGTAYTITESSFEIADNTRLVLLNRGGGLPQNGSIDPATGLGGPGYSSLIVEDADAMRAFFTRWLDYEERTSRDWTVFRPQFRYVTLHARGARTGNLGLVEYAPSDRRRGTGIPPRPPNRGLAGWSIPVRDLAATLRRAPAHGVTVVSGARQYADPRFGRVRIASVLAPNGLLVELFER